MSIMESLGYPSGSGAKSRLFGGDAGTSGQADIEASYSGGNDEGGVNDLKVFDAQGNGMFLDPNRPESTFSTLDYDHPLFQAADDMLSVEFGSWAGEFSAYGTLYADFKQHKVGVTGEMQSGYDSDSHEY